MIKAFSVAYKVFFFNIYFFFNNLLFLEELAHPLMKFDLFPHNLLFVINQYILHYKLWFHDFDYFCIFSSNFMFIIYHLYMLVHLVQSSLLRSFVICFFESSFWKHSIQFHLWHVIQDWILTYNNLGCLTTRIFLKFLDLFSFSNVHPHY